MKTYTEVELKAVLAAHGLWLASEEGGKRANLRSANLYGANLYGADLRSADLKGHDLSPFSILPEGDIIGYKKCLQGKIVKLKIVADVKRSHTIGGRKCRAEQAEVLEIWDGKEKAKEAVSQHNGTTVYKVGEIVKADRFEEDRHIECAGGIHFFITRSEAEAY